MRTNFYTICIELTYFLGETFLIKHFFHLSTYRSPYSINNRNVGVTKKMSRLMKPSIDPYRPSIIPSYNHLYYPDEPIDLQSRSVIESKDDRKTERYGLVEFR